MCEQAGGAYLEQCKGYADKYYKGVTDYPLGYLGIRPAQSAYRNAQKDSNCDGTKYCPPPLPMPKLTADPCSKYGNWMCK